MDDSASLRDLIALAPPPAAPDFGTRTWDEVFHLLGHRLPADYMAFAEVYGTVNFNDELDIQDLRSLPSEPPDRGGMPPYPGRQHTDVYSFGSAAGPYLGWLTHGDPDTWPVGFGEFYGPREKPCPPGKRWQHLPLTAMLLKMFRDEGSWRSRPIITRTNAELYDAAFPEGDPRDNPWR